jgi:hypothetical protein
VRVGRAPLDEDAIRLIEQSNPGIEFDWTRILKAQEAPPEQRSPVQYERRSRPRPREFPSREAQAAPPAPPAPSESEPDAPRLPEPANTAVVIPFPQPEAEASPLHNSAAAIRLGAEGLSRLRGRHAEILTRIAEKITEPVRREELKADAERLNPDSWVTDAEVTAGLEGYETVFETLRAVIGRRRKRRRRRPAAEGGQATPGSGDQAAAAPDAGAANDDEGQADEDETADP